MKSVKTKEIKGLDQELHDHFDQQTRLLDAWWDEDIKDNQLDKGTTVERSKSTGN